MASDPRPLSPHLQVYRWQWTMLLSITHRATGVALSAGALVLVWWLAAAAAGPESHAAFQACATSIIGRLALFGWTFCLFYHLANGIRHLVWDTGRWLDLDSAYRSGIGVVVVAVALTILSWVVAYAAM